MQDVINILSVATGTNSSGWLDQNLFDVSNSTLILIAVMSFLGTNLIAHMTGRDLFVEQITSFSAFFVSALVANLVISNIELPVGSELAQVGITSNIGMTIAGLLLLVLFGREGAYRRS